MDETHCIVPALIALRKISPFLWPILEKISYVCLIGRLFQKNIPEGIATLNDIISVRDI
ncbi:hypothetical protein [Robbsia andropogonis]|uniref:hypothetical protein n=1 Tax=Robbsia andropogonis TaxID=28092 RepID=UPI000A451C3C|nr:hypothetical protein [Robbsia andropogonis]